MIVSENNSQWQLNANLVGDDNSAITLDYTGNFKNFLFRYIPFNNSNSLIRFTMKIHVKESISISAPQEKVQAVITDFHSWQHWSPWLLAEPDAKVEITPDGSRYILKAIWLGWELCCLTPSKKIKLPLT